MKKKHLENSERLNGEEETTLYEETVPSTHKWMTLDRQEKIAKKHEVLSKKSSDKKNK